MIWTKILKYAGILSITGIVIYACVEPFEPYIPGSTQNMLVIEGYINAGPGKTTILLSRLSSLKTSNVLRQEEEAEVYIESDDSESFLLSESKPGTYESGELNLPSDKKYLLHVKLKDGNEYRSELLSVKVTPLMDSITWEAKKDYLYIYVNTHDPNNNTWFYKWRFRQDWEIRSEVSTLIMYNGETLVDRPIHDYVQMLICWSKSSPQALQFATSRQLTKDVMKFPIQKIAYSSDAIKYKYAIMAVQHAITEEEYNYLSLLKKNSTELGSFFDPLPAQLYGNIHNVDDIKEPVVGYIGAYTTDTLRLVIDVADLPKIPVQTICLGINFGNYPDSLEFFLGGAHPLYIPIRTFLYNNDPNKPMVQAVEPYCADCRLRGDTIKPDFFQPWYIPPVR